ncbi:hypothetical protein E3U23_12745 [Erythrobacter litoralis]|uniref:PH domain-containing protein n=1 Tax=Erythrobacter litoralis TaxID=39960 RepID=UPI002435A6CE|nr:PH domain-containing protein [Erythrobacter litoralis]MDG6080055.1 hypothetical protein [Erythrobacter litoralis]
MRDNAPDVPQRTDPRGFVIKAIEGLRAALLPAAAFVFTRGADSGLLVGAIIGAASIVISGVFSYLAWTRLTYAVSETDIRVESGLLSRNARSVPFERIQDVSVKEGLLARIFGLVELTFETGAGAGEDLSLSYLSAAEGERLRNVVRDRRDTQAALAGEPAVEEARLLFAMTPRRVFTFGLFNFSLVVFGVAAATVTQYDDLLPFDIWDAEAWERRLAGPGAWLSGLGVFAQAVGIALLLLALALLGFATGIVRTALREWNFRLERTDKGFRRRRGLLTRTDVVLPVRRVQAVIRSTGFVRARFGWHGLSLVSLAADAGASNHDIAPLAKEAEIDPLVVETGFALPGAKADWQHISRVFAWIEAGKRMRLWLFLAAVILVVQAIVQPGSPLGSPFWALFPVAIGIWKAARIFVAMRRTRYALDKDHIHLRSGWLTPYFLTGAREKLQSVELSRGPLGRRFGYVDLTFGVAGTGLTIPGMPVDAAAALRTELLASMRLRDFSRLN